MSRADNKRREREEQVGPRVSALKGLGGLGFGVFRVLGFGV